MTSFGILHMQHNVSFGCVQKLEFTKKHLAIKKDNYLERKGDSWFVLM